MLYCNTLTVVFCVPGNHESPRNQYQLKGCTAYQPGGYWFLFDTRFTFNAISKFFCGNFLDNAAEIQQKSWSILSQHKKAGLSLIWTLSSDWHPDLITSCWNLISMLKTLYQNFYFLFGKDVTCSLIFPLVTSPVAFLCSNLICQLGHDFHTSTFWWNKGKEYSLMQTISTLFGLHVMYHMDECKIIFAQLNNIELC